MPMEKAFETESHVSVDAAWHQALSFDEPCSVKVVIENLGEDPIYGFYLDEADFNAMIEHGSVDDTVMARARGAANLWNAASADIGCHRRRWPVLDVATRACHPTLRCDRNWKRVMCAGGSLPKRPATVRRVAPYINYELQLITEAYR